MHLFFDTVWKLHIGEIPEKPEVDPQYSHLPVSFPKWEQAIAAIKQNALTVGNPILCPQNMSAVEPGKFYEWIGGYDIVGMGTVAILTLPEEKKNTMENDKIFIDGDFNDSYEARIQRSKGKKKNKSESPSPAASGSVADPKEEGLNIPWDSDYYESRIKELKEALKELLKFADMYLHSKVLEYARGNFEKSELEDSAAIIERARKLISK